MWPTCFLQKAFYNKFISSSTHLSAEALEQATLPEHHLHLVGARLVGHGLYEHLLVHGRIMTATVRLQQGGVHAPKRS